MLFTNNWFSSDLKDIWRQIFIVHQPTKILEIGTYEGASACFVVSTLASQYPIELHCIDTWQGSVEHIGHNMNEVENRFKKNIKESIESVNNEVDLHIYKSRSDKALPKLLAEGFENYFDFIYIDGSHLSYDALFDAVVAFKLLKIDGLMIFDDYLWRDQPPNHKDVLWSPKIAIDAFININYQKVLLYNAPSYQLYMKKISN